jgi:hypothetical protein
MNDKDLQDRARKAKDQIDRELQEALQRIKKEKR